jgi:hypothetical protein
VSLTSRPEARQWWFIPIQIQIPMNSNSIQIISNFDQTKKDLPKLKIFEIKYGHEGFEERNNFLYRSSSDYK